MTREEASEIVGADPRLARWPQADRERLVDRLMFLTERVDPHRALSPTGGVEYHCECGGRTPLPADGVPARVYCLYCGHPEPAGPEGSTPDLATRLATLEAETMLIADIVAIFKDRDKGTEVINKRLAAVEEENARLSDLTNHLVEWVSGQWESQNELNRIKAWLAEDRRQKGNVGP